MNKADRILISHGGGGEMTRRLLAERILPKLSNPQLDPLLDSAILAPIEGRICMTTDGHVVQPLEFPGGDIGRVAVCGTINDIAVMGAEPLALSLSLIIEEGLDFATLDRIVDSIADASKKAGVPIVTGDTKVIEHQTSFGLSITTTGIGRLPEGLDLGPKRVNPGDVVIVSGTIAEHGLAVMSAREGLAFQTQLRSDVAPLNGLIRQVLETGADLKFMRDPTRGGVAGLLADLSEDSGFSIELDENSLPISPVARHTAELLGLDPLLVANEGKVVIVVAGQDADMVLAACKSHVYGKNARVIGTVTGEKPALVELITRAGGRRIVQRPYGEELPRIC